MHTATQEEGLYTSAGRVPTPRPGLDNAERARLAEMYAPLVKRVAYKIAARVPPCVEVQDLIAAGTVGLLTAMDRFDESRGKPFEIFAEWRIRGAILDELRSHDHLSRGARMRARELQRVRKELEQKLGRPVGLDEVAEAAGMDMESVSEALGAGEGPSLLSLDELGFDRTESGALASLHGGDGPPNPYQNAYIQDLRQRLATSIERLPDRLRLILALYYQEGLNYKEIGEVLGRTESRVCQLHKDAVQRLRKLLGEDNGEP